MTIVASTLPALPPGAVDGTPAGPTIQLPSGLVLQRRKLGNAVATDAEVQQVEAGLAALPLADQQLVARAGIVIDLVPTAGLEGGLLGATTIVKAANSSLWVPTHIRVAVASTRTGVDAISEVIQHEIGHAVSVIRNQDRSEAAAISYALAH